MVFRLRIRLAQQAGANRLAFAPGHRSQLANILCCLRAGERRYRYGPMGSAPRAAMSPAGGVGPDAVCGDLLDRRDASKDRPYLVLSLQAGLVVQVTGAPDTQVRADDQSVNRRWNATPDRRSILTP
jgi:hypothetical protein